MRFSPLAVGPDSATITVVADDAAPPHVLEVRAEAQSTLDADPRAPLPPRVFALAQPPPNPIPASASAMVRFVAPPRARVKLDVFDLQGHRVANLVDDAMEPGRDALPFGAGSAVAGGGSMGRIDAGAYFVRLRAPAFTATRRVAEPARRGRRGHVPRRFWRAS